MTRFAGWILGALLVVGAALGLGRLRLDPDVLGMLPSEMPEVAGLKAYHERFSPRDELIVALEAAGGGEVDEEAVVELAGVLERAGLASRVRWRPDWLEEGPGMAELVAYLWLNGPPERTAGLADSLSAEHAAATFETAVEDVATAMEGMDLALRAYDPFGFFRHPSLDALIDSADGGGDGFASEDGRTRLLLVRAPRDVADYREAEAWIGEVKPAVHAWLRESGGGMTARFTGEPAFSAEIGGAMERDMRGTVGITMGFIALLFWWMQRRLRLLAGLVGVLGLTFVTTLGLGGWMFGELSLVAAGFAAILIGLVVDYGVLISQEAKAGGGKGMRATVPSILWAAATTAVVFFALNRSGLPGIAQLGTLVGVGMVAGALLMLGVYVPFVMKAGAGRKIAGSAACPALSRKTALVAALALAVACGGVLGVCGLPGVSFDSRLMRPRDSAAMAAFERLQSAFPEWKLDALRVVVKAPDDATMVRRLGEVAERVEAATLPLGWWPDAAAQTANRAALARIAADREELAGLAGDAGFSDEGVAPGVAVMERLAEMTASGESPVVPQSAAAGEIMRLFVSRDAQGGGWAAGTLADSGDDAPAWEKLESISRGDVLPVGWDLLKPATLPLVRRDLTDVFLPMAGLMVVMLAVVFRRPRPVLACLAALALSGGVLLAAMRLFGIGWNFLNIAAAPLLLGMGIDYGIHVALALRRENGDVRAMWRGTGKAVVFCGVSTSIGFGSLCFASNDGLASLGAVAVIGILTSMAVSVCLLPGWLAAGETRGPSGRHA